MPMSELGRRLVVAAVGIPAGVLVIWVGGWVLAGVVAGLAVMGTLEVYHLARERGWRPFAWLGTGAVLALVGWAALTGTVTAWAPGAVSIFLALALGSLAAAVFRRGPGGDPLLAMGTTLAGAAYAGAPLAFAVLLRRFPEGTAGAMEWGGAFLLMFPIVVTWLADTAAYFVGTHLGRRKLIPSVSPAKTVEGSVGGLVAAVVGSALYAAFLLEPFAPVAPGPVLAAGIGLLIGVVGQVGDLAESVLKREAGVKDSGGLLPGHGGVLDRFDGVYFTLPLTYGLFVLFLT
jgi:phosphatidate cytidylyltransferase